MEEALRIRREEELPVYERLGDVRERSVTSQKIAAGLLAAGGLEQGGSRRSTTRLPGPSPSRASSACRTASPSSGCSSRRCWRSAGTARTSTRAARCASSADISPGSGSASIGARGRSAFRRFDLPVDVRTRTPTPAPAAPRPAASPVVVAWRRGAGSGSRRAQRPTPPVGAARSGMPARSAARRRPRWSCARVGALTWGVRDRDEDPILSPNGDLSPGLGTWPVGPQVPTFGKSARYRLVAPGRARRSVAPGRSDLRPQFTPQLAAQGSAIGASASPSESLVPQPRRRAARISSAGDCV